MDKEKVDNLIKEALLIESPVKKEFNAKLNDAGIPSPSQYKADHGIITNNNKKARRILWNKHVITDILSNSVYIGHLAQKKGSQCLYAGLPYP
jgi:hypothetical protein